MRGETMKDKSKKSTYSTTFGVDPFGVDPKSTYSTTFGVDPNLRYATDFGVSHLCAGILKLLPKTQKNRNPKMVAGFKWWSR